jgi:hypothetical protein
VPPVFLFTVLLVLSTHLALQYCRALLRSVLRIEVSADVRVLAGLDNVEAPQTTYSRLCLLLKLCRPIEKREPAAATLALRVVQLYYRVLQLLGTLSFSVGPRPTAWFRRERQSCVHFFAVLLEDRIVSNREFRSEYLSNSFYV